MKAIKVAGRKPKLVFFTSTVTLTVSLSFLTLCTDLFNNLNGCIHLNHGALLRLPSSFLESPSIMPLLNSFSKANATVNQYTGCSDYNNKDLINQKTHFPMLAVILHTT